MDKLAMGEYGVYVWTCFGLTFLVLVVAHLQTRFRSRHVIADIKTLILTQGQDYGQASESSYPSPVIDRPGYELYRLEAGDGDRLASVKSGFCWPAFFFGPLWAWSKGLVAIGFGLLLIALIFNYVGYELPREVGLSGAYAVILVSFGWAAWVGFSANNWVRRALERQGYKKMDPDAGNSQSQPTE